MDFVHHVREGHVQDEHVQDEHVQEEHEEELESFDPLDTAERAQLLKGLTNESLELKVVVPYKFITWLLYGDIPGVVRISALTHVATFAAVRRFFGRNGCRDEVRSVLKLLYDWGLLTFLSYHESFIVLKLAWPKGFVPQSMELVRPYAIRLDQIAPNKTKKLIDRFYTTTKREEERLAMRAAQILEAELKSRIKEAERTAETYVEETDILKDISEWSSAVDGLEHIISEYDTDNHFQPTLADRVIHESRKRPRRKSRKSTKAKKRNEDRAVARSDE